MFQSPIFGADAQSGRLIEVDGTGGSFNPLFSGLTLKVVNVWQVEAGRRFQSPIFGADAQSSASRLNPGPWSGFNPLFSGLTLKVNRPSTV